MPDDASGRDASGGSPFWSGTITFGLVSVPVNLLPANRSRSVSLRMVSPEGRPLSRRYYTTREARELGPDDIVRGYEIEPDRFVVVDDEELERIAPERTRDIDLRVFVKTTDIDPAHFERAYFLTPAGSSTKAYRLLARVMEETERAGIASFVMRAKEYLVAILAENGILRAETLRFADEVRTPEDVGLPEPMEPETKERKRMEKEIARLAEDRLDPDDLVEQSAEQLRKLAEKKGRAGKAVASPDSDGRESSEVIDLMERLQRSLKGGGGSGSGRTANGRDALQEKTKSELYDRARELEIPGRSSMSKDELIDAISTR